MTKINGILPNRTDMAAPALRWGATAAGLMTAAVLSVPAAAKDSAEAPSPAIQVAQFQAPAADGAGTVAFDIPAQDLAGALTLFGRQAGLQVSVDDADLKGLQSRAVMGTATPAGALAQLLQGTGVIFRFTDATTVVLHKPEADAGRITLGTVSVEGKGGSRQSDIAALPPAYAGGQVARGGRVGALGNQDVMDIPFNMTAYTETTIRNQQAETVGEVLQNDPSVRTTYGYGNFAELFVIRGFPLYSDDLSVDGLFGTSPRQIASSDMFERVEVFKGANAFLNGAAPGTTGIGGGVNLVPKRADDAPLTRVTANYGQTLRGGIHGDMGRRFGPDNAFGVRVNAAVRDGETAVENEDRYMHMASVGLDYRSDQVRATLDVATQRQRVEQGRPTVFLSGTAVPDAPGASDNYAATYSYTDLKDSFAQTRVEYDLLKNVTLHAALGVHDLREDGDYASIRVSNAAGDATARRLTVPREDFTMTGQSGLRATAETGPIRHKVNSGLSLLKTYNRNAYEIGTTANTNLYSPVELDRGVTTSVGGDTDHLPKVSSVLMRSYFFSDTVSDLDERVLLTAGFRYQRIQTLNFNRSTSLESSNFNDTALSPVVGVVYKPTKFVSLYANRIEGLAPGGTAPSSAANAGESLAPYTSTQYEVGGKLDMGTFGGSVALFQTTQPSATTNATTNIYATDGEQRNRGVEFSLFGEPTPGLRLLGGAAFTKAIQTKTAGGTNNDNDAIGVPDLQLNMGAEWDASFLKGLTLSARLLYTSSQYVNAGNTQEIDSWARLDLGARLVRTIAGREANFLLNIENVTDNGYWASAQGGYLVQGAPLTVKLSLAMDF